MSFPGVGNTHAAAMVKAFLPLCAFLLPLMLRAAEPGVFSFHHEGVLGTSLDLQVVAADAQQAAAAESAVLAEIERMRKILSTYDPASEISRVNAASGTVPCSQELLDVLAGYDWWNAKSGGAYNGHLGDLIRVWRAAEQAGTMPDAAALQRAAAALRVPAWKIDAAARTVTRTTAQPLNVVRSARATSSAKPRQSRAQRRRRVFCSILAATFLRVAARGRSASPIRKTARTTRRRSRR